MNRIDFFKLGEYLRKELDCCLVNISERFGKRISNICVSGQSDFIPVQSFDIGKKYIILIEGEKTYFKEKILDLIRSFDRDLYDKMLRK